MFNAVFFNDRVTKKMNKEERLKYHQKHSTPIMEKLKTYCNSFLERKIVEPNSSFGKAVKYLNNHWEGLMRIPLNPITDSTLSDQLFHFKRSPIPL
jgi:hypothetical protein